MNKVLFSIIIPHYNNGESLIKLLKTIPEDEDIEIIIVDDNSKEELNYKSLTEVNTRIKLLKNINKKGAGGARNTGLDNALGEWILFADSDDFFIEGAFDIIKKYKKNKEDIIFFNCTSIFIETGKKAQRHIFFQKILMDYLKNKNQHTEKTLRFEYGVPWGKMIKKSFIDKYKIKFDETIIINDRMFSVLCGYYAKQILAVNKIIYCVTRNKGSLTTLRDKKVFLIKLEILDKINNFFIEKNENKYRPCMLGFILESYNYGFWFMIKTYISFLKKRYKILPNEFFKNILNGFYIKKIYEKIIDKNYLVKNK